MHLEHKASMIKNKRIEKTKHAQILFQNFL
jgi:hypothetical protein